MFWQMTNQLITMNTIIAELNLYKKCRAKRADFQDRREKAGSPDWLTDCLSVCPSLTAWSGSVFIEPSCPTITVTRSDSDQIFWLC